MVMWSNYTTDLCSISTQDCHIDILCHTRFAITGEATSSLINTGAVIGGTIPVAIALMALVILLLGGLICYKKKKSRKLHIRYSVIQYL